MSLTPKATRSATHPRPLPSPQAETFSVERLVSLVKSGRVRIPPFQRALRWGSDDVVQLLDSMARGYPVGSLLLHKHHAPAATLQLGPLRIEAAERHDSLHVVDGQQRIVSLAAALGRPLPLPAPATDAYVIYYDPAADGFVAPKRHATIPDDWVPLPVLGDATGLQEWLFDYPHNHDAARRKRIFDASARLREYKLPAYIVEDATEDALRDIFFRINKTGKALEWKDVHTALYGRRDNDEPSSLPELAEALAKLGFGTPDSALTLRCLIAYKGLDVTRTLAEHERREPGFLDGGTAAALPAIRSALDFVRRDCLIPHIDLIPSSAIVPPLVRFFHLHPTPTSRNRALLRRVVWRFLIANPDDRSFQRQAISTTTADTNESDTVQALLRLLPRTSVGLPPTNGFFDARSRESRLILIALAALHPRDLTSHQPIAVADLLNDRDTHTAFRHIVAGTTAHDATRTAANRVLLPHKGLARSELMKTAAPATVLATHAIPPEALAALRTGDTAQFLSLRQDALDTVCAAFFARVAEWDVSDRPSLDDVLRSLT